MATQSPSPFFVYAISWLTRPYLTSREAHGAYMGTLGLMEYQKHVEKIVRNALFIINDVTIFYRAISCV